MLQVLVLFLQVVEEVRVELIMVLQELLRLEDFIVQEVLVEVLLVQVLLVVVVMVDLVVVVEEEVQVLQVVRVEMVGQEW
jgi:hypothetical protein